MLLFVKSGRIYQILLDIFYREKLNCLALPLDLVLLCTSLKKDILLKLSKIMDILCLFSTAFLNSCASEVIRA